MFYNITSVYGNKLIHIHTYDIYIYNNGKGQVDLQTKSLVSTPSDLELSFFKNKSEPNVVSIWKNKVK